MEACRSKLSILEIPDHLETNSKLTNFNVIGEMSVVDYFYRTFTLVLTSKTKRKMTLMNQRV